MAGISVGAILVHSKNLQSIRLELEKHFGKIRFRGVERQDDGRLLVHLPSSVAGTLERHELSMENATYLPGVRQYLLLPAPSSDDCDAMFTFVELFAGIGGFRLGLEPLGGKCVLACESSSKASAIYRSFFTNDNVLVEGDVLDLDLQEFPSYTMLTAGFPCQPFSNRGSQQGLEDEERGQLYLELVRILQETQPECFLFENVSQLVLMDGGSRDGRIKGKVSTFTRGNVLQMMIQAFCDCGYQVDWKVVNSRHFVPQNRERVYIVGTKRDLNCPPLDWNKVMPNPSCTKTVRDILEPSNSLAVQTSVLTPCQWNKVLSVRDDDLFINLDNKAPTLISQYHRVSSLSSKYIATADRGRFLTPRECSRIMGFPEEYPCESPHFYTGIGNAVTPPVIGAIGRELLRCIQEGRQAPQDR
jgi:DNA (cytosine-5)-methyltransferase 1